jgi:transcription antitermination factor NusG
MTTEKIKYWHAIYVSSRAEKKVCENLNNRNIEAYVPVIKTIRQWSDRKKKIELPLISGYVFVRINLSEKDSVLQTKSVVNFVKSQGVIATIREEEIERLKQLVELGYHLEVTPLTTINHGDKIKISSGTLKGIEGVVIDANGNKLIEVLLESIGQCIRVKLPKEMILTA